MNILFFVGAYPDQGGVAKVTTILSNKFVDEGHNVSICSLVRKHEELLSELCPKVKFVNLSFPINTKENKHVLSNYINKFGIDFIICQWATDLRAAKLCRAAINGTKCKLITVHHTSPNRNNKIQNALDRIQNSKGLSYLKARANLFATTMISRVSLWLVNYYSDSYVVLSPSLIKVANSFIWKKANHKVKYIYNPITCEQPSEPILNKRKKIIFVGRIDKITKRADRIIDVWSYIYKSFPDWNLLLIGDGPEKDSLFKFAQDNNIKNIEFIGYDNPVKYYMDASVLLLTSNYEGFPLVVSEAMAYGVVPLVLGSFPAAYDIVNNNEDGIVVPLPFNPKHFSSELEKLLLDPDKLRKLSENAIKSSNKYSLSQIYKCWFSLFAELKMSSGLSMEL